MRGKGSFKNELRQKETFLRITLPWVNGRMYNCEASQRVMMTKKLRGAM